MSVIDKLKKLRNMICKNDINENENMGKKAYRLHYLYFSNQIVKEMHDLCCDTFIGPENFSEDDMFKVISYVFDHADREKGSYRCCCNTTQMLSEIGFTIINDINKNEYKVIDLFSVISTDNGYMFKQSKYYNDYFEWYQDGITKEMVEDIYINNNMKMLFKSKQKINQKND